MLRFVAGFVVASLVWGGFLAGHKQGVLGLELTLDPVVEEPEPLAEESAPEDEQPTKRKSRRKRRSTDRRDTRPRLSGEAAIGDDLGGPDTRDLGGLQAGGEEQLTGSEIERGFDQAMPSIRRCLILAASDEPVTGKLVFGLRVAGSGRVERVSLKGPAAITQSEAGACLTKAARGIAFPSFDGPDMLVNFPLTLE